MKTKVKVEIPVTPNFIRLTPGGTAPIHLFTDEELRAIGREWTKKLIESANRDR